MSATWRGGAPPAPHPVDWAGWARIVVRGAAAAALLIAGLAVLVPLRLLERALYGPARPASARLVRRVSRAVLRAIGLDVVVEGQPAPSPCAIVANHVSWLDILVLNGLTPVVFVAKSEVAGWPGIGLMARATGTLFIRREAREARAQTALIASRLAAGQRPTFFPEGTSTDGRRVLPFRSTLFAALTAAEAPPGLSVQPVSLAYHAPAGRDPRCYGWWGDMSLGRHLAQVLSVPRQGRVDLQWHTAIQAGQGTSRKALAQQAEAAVREGLTRALDAGGTGGRAAAE